MKISFNWLKKFIDLDIDPYKTADILTFSGVETTVLSDSKPAWTKIVSAKILEAQKHPNADKLWLCKVSDGSEVYQIVCGAPNVREGMIVALAKIGATLPGGFEIKKAKIRSIESEGMMCSKKELGLALESDGIMELDPKTKLGQPLEIILDKVEDAVLEFEITPNRGDCLSHLGIARELAAKLKKNLTLPPIKTSNALLGHNVKIESDKCQRYIGVIIKDIEVKPSPEWLADALEKCGVRPINNIVDITNYVMLSLGQPMHAFDLAKLDGQEIIVRNAKTGEKILALDSKEYELDESMLVICDKKAPVAIAGIMGGEVSGVTNNTKAILLESAIFDASSIRKTSKKLKLSSDSSYRYERGVDWGITETASWFAINLITAIAGGSIVNKTDIATKKFKPTEIVLRFERVKKVLGYTIEENEIAKILRFLGCDLLPRKEVVLCKVPSWRNDISAEIDLIEELARINGYENIPQVNLDYDLSIGTDSYFCPLLKKIRMHLFGLGFCEALNYSFLESADVEKFGLKSYYKISNPVSKENELLRPSLLPALYKNLLTNIGQGAASVSLFECGKIFTKNGEKESAAGIMYGDVWGDWWKWENADCDTKYNFYFLGAVVKNFLPNNEFCISNNLSPQSFFHPGQTASIVYRGKSIGQFGTLNPMITQELKNDVFYFEIDVEAIGDLRLDNVLFKPFAKFPPVKRDLSFVASKSVPFEKIEQVIKSVKKEDGLIEDYRLFSVYSNDEKIGAQNIAYSLSITYRDLDKTLTDVCVNENMQKLIDKLNKKLSITLRV
ncbi:MAG: phenylalanine--tRNA ligase subunit beta [Elusimicrobiota bacterium]|jgi:phenylalanyl-tRNA synthetase beta chain|nr:phenylalanine--tRNA ligase subunit beta [Elusimicrobiota bacterium]